jgi:hypothetical protein
VALLMLWLALLVSNASFGGLIHVLLLAALGLVLWNVQGGETSA